ncbi:MAG: 4-phosphoerythronate dehydrogenase [Prevotellaceae bacterium]|jgi:erythronate-4-phosphate dehydrogenase|nr:4-phosphoerythronate dehydrogenase [Prevotellaceae bacterium]
MKKIKILVDADIPFLRGALEPYADVTYAAGRDIRTATLRNADALLIRTRTRCDAALLSGSSVRFIATATIGVDHIDLEYCRQQGIAVYSAAGCNAAAVAQYVVCIWAAMAYKTGINVRDCVLGVVGVGHVGRRVAAAAQALGMTTLLNDPPREALETATAFVSLDELLTRADIVTMHVPLTPATRGMANATFFKKMKTGAAFINTSRGEVVDEEALLGYCACLRFLALDVWQREPAINRSLLKVVDIATPHIAGYSIQGKSNATTMTVRALAGFFGINALQSFTAATTAKEISLRAADIADDLYAYIFPIYPVLDDSARLHAHPQRFEQLRNSYTLRNEFQIL